MKIIITQAGWAGYTGFLGSVEFKDGVSVDDSSMGEIRALAAIVSVEEYKDGAATGKNPSVAQEIIDKRTLPADVVVSRADNIAPEAPVVAKIYTADELSEIADKGGIKGVREVAGPLGLKGNSIAELIGKILGAYADAKAKADQAERDAAA